MAQKSMIPITDLGIWKPGISREEKGFSFLPDQRGDHSSAKKKERQEMIEGLKIGVTIWGLLSAVSLSFWASLIYLLLF